jgi:hypothetical protein
MYEDSDKKRQDLTLFPNMYGVFDYANKEFPGWVVGFSDRYSEDYPHLTCTWVETSKALNVKPAQVMLLNSICDIFTRAGFSIRHTNNFQPCKVCKDLLPTQKSLQNLRVVPPFEWLDCCRCCASLSELKEVDEKNKNKK